jgi:gas vesicle protein GvpA/GvpJ/GvpM family
VSEPESRARGGSEEKRGPASKPEFPSQPASPPQRSVVPHGIVRADLAQRQGGPANLADILERVLDKGIVIAGDIQINLLDIELLTIKIRLLVASVDRAKEMGINWWESDPTLTRGAKEVQEENDKLKERLNRLEGAMDVIEVPDTVMTETAQLALENEQLRARLQRLEDALAMIEGTPQQGGKR